MPTSPIPSRFPLPPDVKGFWAWEKGHFPRPLTPLSDELVLRVIAAGFSQAMEAWACPMGVQCRAINAYGYFTLTPFPLHTETLEERLARYQHTLSTVLPRMGELWEQQWLPSILPALERARTTDYRALSHEALWQRLETMLAEHRARWTVHGYINFVTIAASWFADFYHETFVPDDPTEPYLLLQGFPTRSLDAGHGLWQLSRRITQNPILRRIFEGHEPAALLAQLERVDAGRAFLHALHRYLDEFGWRSDAFELADPTWRENPAIPLRTLQGYMALDDGADPMQRFRAAVQTRERLLAQARARLANAPAQLARFNELYAMACAYVPLTENHNFYIDQRGNAVLRLPLLELGRRLVQRGSITEAHEVFLLYLAEIRQGLAGTNQQALIAQRQSALAAWSRVVPPLTIGEPPPPGDDPWEEAVLRKMFGMPPEPSRDPDVLSGTGASPGTVQGTAKVLRTLAEASRVQPGDILVCDMTTPAWTPLFSIVSAIVADTGGVLSHCAIVAREYRLPCVVGTAIGTAVLQDGMQLTVDGSQGIVRIDARLS